MWWQKRDSAKNNTIYDYKSNTPSSPTPSPPTASSEARHKTCECKIRPKTCVCFKTKCVERSKDKVNISYIDPPPFIILLNYDRVKEWGIQDDDLIYIVQTNGKRIVSTKKFHEYRFPHCHEDPCLEKSEKLYRELISEKTAQLLPEPYAEIME